MDESATCVVCGAPACRGKRHPLCQKHIRYVYVVTCPRCGRRLYRKTRSAKVRCEHCLNSENSGIDVLKFLRRAKTEAELVKALGESWRDRLQSGWDGYNLFVQRNEWNEQTYVLLPELRDTIEVAPKVWRYHVGLDEKGVPDPYLLIQIPDESWQDDELIIVPLYDVHLGHFAHRHEKFLSYIEWIRQNQNIFAVIGGDLMENALEGDKGMTYDQESPPATQLEEAVRLLGSVAHKILVATSGNHESRTYRRAGIDPMAVICERLSIPYFDGPVLMSVCAGGYNWLMWVTHGSGNSQTKGGKLNSAQRPHRFNGMLHFSLSGHVHDPIVNPETVLTQDMVNCRLRYMTRWTVIAQSFLGWKGTYAYKAGWGPPGRGGVACVLQRNGEYKATLE